MQTLLNFAPGAFMFLKHIGCLIVYLWFKDGYNNSAITKNKNPINTTCTSAEGINHCKFK